MLRAHNRLRVSSVRHLGWSCKYGPSAFRQPGVCLRGLPLPVQRRLYARREEAASTAERQAGTWEKDTAQLGSHQATQATQGLPSDLSNLITAQDAWLPGVGPLVLGSLVAAAFLFTGDREGLGLQLAGGSGGVLKSQGFSGGAARRSGGRRGQGPSRSTSQQVRYQPSSPDTSATIPAGREVKSKEAELDAALKVAAELERQVAALARDVRAREDQLEGMQSTAKAQTTVALSALKESQRKVALLEAMVLALRERLSDEETRNTQLSNEVAAGKEELSRAHSARMEAVARLEVLKTEVEAAQQLLAQAEARTKDLEQRVEDLTAASQTLQHRVRELEHEVSAHTTAAERVSRDAEARIASIQAAAEKEVARVAALQQALAEREAQLFEAQAQLAQAREGAPPASAQGSQLREAKAELVRSKEAMEQALANREYELKQAKEELAKNRAEMRQALAAREFELRHAKDQLKDVSGTQELQVLAAREAELQRAKEELDKTKEDMQLKLSARESALKAAQDELSGSKKSLKEIDKQLAAKQKELLEVEARAAKAEGALQEEQQQSAHRALALVQEKEQQVVDLRQQLSDAVAQVERESQTKAAELAAVRGTLEAALAAARLEVHTSKQQLTQMQHEIESVLGIDLGPALAGVSAGTAAAAPAPSKQQSEELRGLSRRQAQLSAEITARHQALEQQALEVLPKLQGGVAAQAQALRARHTELLVSLQQAEKRWETDGSGMQVVTKLRRDVSAVVGDLTALLRSGMSAEQRTQERAVRAELADKEAELRAVTAQIMKLQPAGPASSNGFGTPHAAADAGAGSGAAASKGALSLMLGQRLRVLLKEREEAAKAQLEAALKAKEAAMIQQLKAREAQTLAELRARADRIAAHEKQMHNRRQADLDAVERKYKQQLEASKEELAAKIREAEAAWRKQLEAAQAAAAHASNDRQRLAAEVTLGAVKARQQLAELATAREELAARSKQLAEIKQTYDSSRAAAERRAASAAAEAALVAGQVQTLQKALKEREEEVQHLRVIEQQQEDLVELASQADAHLQAADALAGAPAATGGREQFMTETLTPGVTLPQADDAALQAEATAAATTSAAAQQAQAEVDVRRDASPEAAENPSLVIGRDLSSVGQFLARSKAGSPGGAAAAEQQQQDVDALETVVTETVSKAVTAAPVVAVPADEPSAVVAPPPAAAASSIITQAAVAPPASPAPAAPPAVAPPTPTPPAAAAQSAPAITPPAQSAPAPVAKTAAPPSKPPIVVKPAAPPKPIPVTPLPTPPPPAASTSTAPPKTQAAPQPSQPASPASTQPPAAPPSTISKGKRVVQVMPSSKWGQPPGATSTPTTATPASQPPKTPSGAFPEVSDLSDEINRIATNLVSGQAPPGTKTQSPSTSTTSSTSVPTSTSSVTSSSTPAPAAAAAAPAAPTSVPVTPRRGALRLTASGFMVPHEAKVDRGGEDAFFVSTEAGGALGVADGVGGWAADGVDVAAYARGICSEAEAAIKQAPQVAGPQEALAIAQEAVRLPGSCTACVAALRPEEQVLEVANLGDSGLRIVRGKQVIAATAIQEHTFNMPYQMAHPDILSVTDTADDAQVYKFPVEAGDIIIMATDGLWDNLWDEQVISIIAQTVPLNQVPDQRIAARIAQRLVQAAHIAAKDDNARTPWAVESAAASGSLLARMFPRGGKMDDVTCVVALVGMDTL